MAADWKASTNPANLVPWSVYTRKLWANYLFYGEDRMTMICWSAHQTTCNMCFSYFLSVTLQYWFHNCSQLRDRNDNDLLECSPDVKLPADPFITDTYTQLVCGLKRQQDVFFLLPLCHPTILIPQILLANSEVNLSRSPWLQGMFKLSATST